MVQSFTLLGYQIATAAQQVPANNTGDADVELPVVGTLPPRQIPETNNEWLPWVAVLGAWACFGSFAVPMKSQAVINAGVNPLIFQCYKTFWAFISSFLVLFFQPFQFTWWGVLSGFSWVPAGVAAVIAVQNIGIACGQAIWQVTIIGTSFMWSFLVLRDGQVYNWWGTAMALAGLLIGVVGMTTAFNMRPEFPPEGKDDEDDSSSVSATPSVVISDLPRLGHVKSAPASLVQATRTRGSAMRRKSTILNRTSFALPGLALMMRHSKSEGRFTGRELGVERRNSPREFSSSSSSDDEDFEQAAMQLSYPLGVAAAIFNGVWGGASLVPSHFSEIQGVHFVISFGIGALIANVLIMIAYFFYKSSQGEEMPPAHFRVMLVPGFLSGMLWAGGNFCSLYAVSTLGQGVGYSLVQASVMVSGLWGILYYKEMAGEPILYWAFACLICGMGVAGLALERVP